jgi:superfamily I DNA/RNA helicase
VPGARSSLNLMQETIKRRANVEKEVAMLWESVTNKKNLYQVLCEANGVFKDLEGVKTVMSGAFEEYRKQSKSQPAEFLRLTALATGAWIKPDSFVNDVSRVLAAFNENGVTANDKVRLMTMRKAKGLQADKVIMIGLEDDIMPNPISEPEEEARIFYVSMTRAKEELFMLHAFKRPRNIS